MTGRPMTGWVVALALGGATAAGAGMWMAEPRDAAASLPVIGTLPAVRGAAVTAAGARPFALTELAGRVWIAGFIFTSCAGPCPLVTAAMAGLQEKLPAAVRLVSVTVDPDHDTPPVLRRYARAAAADPARWLFLRLDAPALYRLVCEGFRMTVFADPGAPAGFRVRHDTRLALVDARGRVRGVYSTEGGRAPEAAVRDAAALVAAGGS